MEGPGDARVFQAAKDGQSKKMVAAVCLHSELSFGCFP